MVFNRGLRKDTEERVQREVNDYNSKYELLSKNSENLYLKREEAKKILEESVSVINEFKNTPETMKISVAGIKINLTNYKDVLDIATKEINDANLKAGGSAAAGVAAGVGVAALAPTAAMGLATTFGVASTGTAISALSGAAASNAALAWLGGGALAAGGGGMASGSAILALAGPIGWGIAGAGVVGAGVLMNGKNKKVIKELQDSSVEIRKQTAVFELISTEISEMIKLTNSEMVEILARLAVAEDYSKNFIELSDDQKSSLGVLVNLTKSATERLNKTLGEDNKF